MHVAVDTKTGKVIGQVLDELYWREDPAKWTLNILTSEGRKNIPAASVRLEKV